MSEQQDQWRMTLPKGQFFENIHGDDTLAAAEQAEAKRRAEAERVSEAERLAKVSQPEPPVAVVDESSDVPIESEAIVENPVDAPPAAPEVVPPAEVPVLPAAW